MLLGASCRAVYNASTNSPFSPFPSLSCASFRYRNKQHSILQSLLGRNSQRLCKYQYFDARKALRLRKLDDWIDGSFVRHRLRFDQLLRHSRARQRTHSTSYHDWILHSRMRISAICAAAFSDRRL